MKNILLATAATFALTTSAFAADLGAGLGFAGDVEYDIEAETTAIEFGPALSMAGFLVEPKMHASADFAGSGATVDFTGVSAKATYGVTANVSVYGSVVADKDFKYDTATVGVGFNF